MPAPIEEDIRKRAYQLWKSAGKPNGNPDGFWYQAEERDTQGKRGAGRSAAWHDRQSSYLSIRVNTRFELISPFATAFVKGVPASAQSKKDARQKECTTGRHSRAKGK